MSVPVSPSVGTSPVGKSISPICGWSRIDVGAAGRLTRPMSLRYGSRESKLG